MEKEYLKNVRDVIRKYKKLGEAALDQLSEEEIHIHINPEDNNIATIVKHLSGNMLSRWTDFWNTDGEKSWRKRDNEFIDDIQSKTHLLKIWEKGWKCLMDAIEGVKDEQLSKSVTIRNEPQLLLYAINTQIAHYAYHIGQLVFLAKSIKGKDWKSLSIPKNGSEIYNLKMFNKSRSK